MVLTLPERWSRLTPEQLAQAKDYAEKWQSKARDIRSINYLPLTAAARRLYSALDSKEPRIFRCDSPWQVAAMPVLLAALSHLPPSYGRQVLEKLTLPKWSQLAKNLLDQTGEAFLSNLTLEDKESFDFLHVDFRLIQGQSNKWPSVGEPLIQHGRLATQWLPLFKALDSHLNDNMDPDVFLQLRNVLVLESDIPHALVNEQIRTMLTASSGTENQLNWARGMFGRFTVFPEHPIEREFVSQLGPLLSNQLTVALRSPRQLGVHGNSLQQWMRTLWLSSLNIISWASADFAWLPLYLFPRELFGKSFYSKADNLLLDSWSKFARVQNPCAFFTNACFICDPPEERSIDQRGRLHNENGLAIRYKDGFEFYSWHGIALPKWIISSPEMITVEHIFQEDNIEVRRVMIERFGTARYLKESNAEKIQEDECGVLYRKEQNHDEPIVMVEVTNSTAEPDGTYKKYYLRVPSTTPTARAAVAWTFGLSESEYNPEQET